ncbi:MAG: glucosamine-6-phosphate isomerase [Candidatus Hydrogenedentota bacterium]|nr:MAG: glucosamine-6-phosphate isomerase [Candidatus Hydrogenedentota bacterium]
MNLMTTISGSMLEDYFPAGWDLEAIDACCSRPPETIAKRERWWNKEFKPLSCESLEDFDVKLGHEIAHEIAAAHDAKKPIAFILPVGPMGMYKWAVYFLKEWGVSCGHVHGFNMDEWSDSAGKTLPAKDSGSFQNAMEQAFYTPLGSLTVPKKQRHYATKKELPTFGKQIRDLKKKGAKLVTVFGIGRACHIAFWEPHFADEYATLEDWKGAEYRIAAQLHPMTIEQNAITSFKSRTTLVPTRANTVGPGLFLQSDKIIGGCDGALGRGMMWQGMSLWATLHHKPTPWIPSTFMPTLPGKLFFLQELAGPLEADCN